MKKLRPEESFLRAVLAMALLFGWRRAHFRPARTATGWRTALSGDGKGFPDLFLVNRQLHAKLVAELKVPPNKVTPEQRAWLDDCEAVGIPAFVWTPADWQEIEYVLQHGTDD
jgi:hypothetical protein